MEKFSADSLFDNRLKVLQPEKGYRFSMDAVILASHIKPSPDNKIIDIGCGCGIIPLVLGFRFPDVKIIGIEIQKSLASLAQKNIIKNKMTDKIYIINRDIGKIRISDIKGNADIIISNPPYKKRGSGRLNPDLQKAVARHEIKIDPDKLFKSSKYLLASKGKIYIIYPAERLPDLILKMTKYRLGPDTIRFVHTKKNIKAKLVIVSGTKNSPESCSVQSPLYIYDSENNYSYEYASMFKS